MFHSETQIFSHIRTVTNVPANAAMTNNNKNNNEGNQAAGDAAPVEGPEATQLSTSNANGNNAANAGNYDVSKARKSMKRVETEVW